jgi:aryl-alcohol dehydrogenase-like predicted oxidoreductase
VERRTLGRNGIDVPVIGMGTWKTFDTDEDRAPIAGEALAAGVDLFDSSPMYGKAEDTLAAALQGRRDRALVATKIWSDSAEEGRRQADHALELFGHVDIYQVHNLVGIETQLKLLEGLRDEGRVRTVGATHYQAHAFPELMQLMRTGRLGMIQVPYNPLRQEVTKAVLPLAQERGLGVLVMSPLQYGVMDARPKPAELRELGVETWPEAVLKWIVSDPRVSCVLTATQRPGRITANARAGERPFYTREQRTLVEQIARSGGSSARE